jgi:hypothetical protein
VFRTISGPVSPWESSLPPELLRLPEELARVDVLLDDPAFFAPFAPYFHPGPVGFHNSATGADLGFYAARSYSLIKPPSTARRWIRSRERSATGWSGRGGRSWRLR